MSLFHVANNTGIAVYPLIGGLVGAAVGWRWTFAVTAGLTVVAAVILVPLLLRIEFRVAPVAGARWRRCRAGPLRPRADGGDRRHELRRRREHDQPPRLPEHDPATVRRDALGLGGISIATAIALMSITGLLVATPGGMLGDRIGRRRVITAGLAAVAVGDLVFLLTGDLVTFLLAAALIGFGDFFTSSQTALLSEIVPPERRTRVLSSYRFSADLGALIGPVALAAVMDSANAQTAIVVAAAVLLTASLAARVGVPSRASSPAVQTT